MLRARARLGKLGALPEFHTELAPRAHVLNTSHLEPNWRRTGQLARGYLGVTDTPEKGVDLSALADTEMYVITRLPRSRGFKASRAGCADGTYSTTTYRVGGHTLGWDPRQGPRLTPTAVKRVECTWGDMGYTRDARSRTLLSGVRSKKTTSPGWIAQRVQGIVPCCTVCVLALWLDSSEDAWGL